MSVTKIVHFSDVLCVWAYVGQANVYRLVEEFGDRVSVEVHYCSVFPDTRTKISRLWGGRGGFDGYGQHVRDVAGQFDNLPLHEDVWTGIRPRSSASPHLFLKAVELLEPEAAGSAFEDRLPVRAAKQLRTAFFEQAQDISNWSCQREICDHIGLSFDDVLAKIETGEAIARLAADYELAQSQGVQGSPTYLMNEGRQKLFGNVGYGILVANVTEVLRGEISENASECS